MKLVLFVAGVETLEYFTKELLKSWEKKDYDIFIFDLSRASCEVKRLGEFIGDSKEKIVAFSFNHEGIAGEKYIYYYDGDLIRNIWDDYNIRFVNMIVDHPLYYHKYICFLPKDYCQINIDKNHFEYMRHFYPEIKEEHFLITAGMSYFKEDIKKNLFSRGKSGERTIDIAFTGNYTPREILRKSIEKMGQEYIDFYDSVLEMAIDNPEKTIDEIGQKALKDEIKDIDDKDIKEAFPTLMYVDLAFRFHYRKLAIRALMDLGFDLTLVGAGFDLLEREIKEDGEIAKRNEKKRIKANLRPERGRLIKLGMGDTRKCLDCLSKAKISLNVMPWFKEGAHDRIFSSMLNGAICLTDSSKFLDEEILRGEYGYTYKLSKLREYELSGYDIGPLIDLGTDLRNLLENDKKRLEMAIKAFDYSFNYHRWENRAKIIEKFF